VGRPSPRASANFRPSALGKPRDTKPCSALASLGSVASPWVAPTRKGRLLRRDTKRHFVAARTFLLRRLNSPVPKASDWLNEVSREAARVGVFVRRFRRFSCRGHLTQTEGRDDAATTGEGRLCRAVHVKVDGNHHATFKPRRRRVVLSGVSRASDAPRFVVARSANPICRHIWNSICGIAAMLTNRVFAHKSLGTPEIKGRGTCAAGGGYDILYANIPTKRIRKDG